MGLEGASSQVDALNFCQQYAEVLLFRLELPDRRCYHRRVTKQRWPPDTGAAGKIWVVTPVDQRYFDIGSLERPCCRDAGRNRRR